jgi:hypothetical protein
MEEVNAITKYEIAIHSMKAACSFRREMRIVKNFISSGLDSLCSH